MKQESRILGIDDGPFDKSANGKVLVVGTVFRGGEYPDAVLSSNVDSDGDDSTERIIEMVRKCRQRGQLHAIMMKGIALGGFNVVDIAEVARKTKIPVVVVVRDYPDFKEIERVLLKRIPNGQHKLELIRQAGAPVKISIRGKALYMQFAGISEEKARRIAEMTSTRSFIPEPIRLAHMIAAGIVLGRSGGRV